MPPSAASPVVLRFPADPAYVVLARTTAAALAARIGFGLDRVEDVRLALDEVCAAAVAARHGEVTCALTTGDDALTVVVTFAADAPIPEDGFSWLVLRSLAGEVGQELADGTLTVRLRCGMAA